MQSQLELSDGWVGYLEGVRAEKFVEVVDVTVLNQREVFELRKPLACLGRVCVPVYLQGVKRQGWGHKAHVSDQTEGLYVTFVTKAAYKKVIGGRLLRASNQSKDCSRLSGRPLG